MFKNDIDIEFSWQLQINLKKMWKNRRNRASQAVLEEMHMLMVGSLAERKAGRDERKSDG